MVRAKMTAASKLLPHGRAIETDREDNISPAQGDKILNLD
jgi:hypothetical protein